MMIKKKYSNMNSLSCVTVGEKSRFPPTIAGTCYVVRIAPTISDFVFDSEEYYNKLRKVNIRKAHSGSDGITLREIKIEIDAFMLILGN